MISIGGPIRAILILAALVAIPTLLGGVFAATLLPKLQRTLLDAGEMDFEAPLEPLTESEIAAAREQVENDFIAFERVVDDHLRSGGAPPSEYSDLAELWNDTFAGEEPPSDPFDGLPYGFDATSDGLRLWSSGPDREGGTDDDLEHYFELPGPS